MDTLFNAIETIKETTETMKQAREEIVRLQNLNEALLEAAKDAYEMLKDQYITGEVQEKLKNAITKAEPRP